MLLSKKIDAEILTNLVAIAQTSGADITALEDINAEIETLKKERTDMLNALQEAFDKLLTNIAKAANDKNNTQISYNTIKIV